MSTASLSLNFGGKIQNFSGSIVRPSPKTMIIKAVKAWLGLWAVALLCLPVPVVHLVITPLGLLFGPIMGVLVFFKSRRVIEKVAGETLCPHCQHKVQVHFEDSLPPLYGICPNCRAGYQLVINNR